MNNKGRDLLSINSRFKKMIYNKADDVEETPAEETPEEETEEKEETTAD